MTSYSHSLFVLAASLLLTTSALAVPPSRLSSLSRGINMSAWMWIPEAGDKPENEAARRGFVTDAELTHLREIGLTHVRLPFEPRWMWDERSHTLRPDETAEYFDAADRCAKAGLAVIIDAHYLKTTWVTPTMAGDDPQTTRFEELELFWAALAARAATTDPERVFLEILNEPHDLTKETKNEAFNKSPKAHDVWPVGQARLIDIIRKAAPNHTIIATGDDYGGISGLLRLRPVADSNIVYSFHFYDPMFFTHQSAAWGWWVWKDLKSVPWPATRAQLEGIAAGQLNKEVHNHVEWSIDREPWTEAKLKAKLQQAADWSAKNSVPVYCGEYGVYTKASPAADRVAWIKAVNAALDELKIGRAMWDYSGGFRMTVGNARSRTVERDVAEAMGLRP